MFGRRISYWNSPLLEDVLVVGGVSPSFVWFWGGVVPAFSFWGGCRVLGMSCWFRTEMVSGTSPQVIYTSYRGVFHAYPPLFSGGIWVFPKIGVPQHGWFIMENPIKWMIWGENPLFSETSIYFPSSLFKKQKNKLRQDFSWLLWTPSALEFRDSSVVVVVFCWFTWKAGHVPYF